MRKLNKKTISIIVIIALVFSSYGCLELWGRYSPVLSPAAFMAIAAPVIFAYLYTPLMLTRNGVIAANLLNLSPALTAVIKPPRATFLVYTIAMVWVVVGAVVFNGFYNAQGVNFVNGAEPVIGTYRIIQPDETIVRTSNVIATSSNVAYIDLNDNATYDTDFEPSITYDSNLDKMTIQFPPWGGGPSGTPGYDITDYGVLELKPGIFTFTGSGEYQVDWTFTSIDPDTGGPDDSQGTSPMVKNFTSTVFRWGVPSTGGNLLLLE